MRFTRVRYEKNLANKKNADINVGCRASGNSEDNDNSEDNGPVIKVIIEITKMRIISLLFIVGVLGTGKERRKEK